MSRFVAMAFAASALLALPAIAEDETGFYVSGFVGAGFPGDVELTGTQTPAAGAPGVAGAPAIINAEFDNDTTLGVALGYKTPWEFFGLFHTRLELEISTLEADVSNGSFNSGNQPFSGDASIDFFLINNYSDIIWRDDQRVVPLLEAASASRMLKPIFSMRVAAQRRRTSPRAAMIPDWRAPLLLA